MALKLIPFRLYSKIISASRIKYWRGYGVHSPFMYRMVRSALMKHRLLEKNALESVDFNAWGICRRERTMIKNIFVTNGYKDFQVVDSPTTLNSDTLYLVPLKCSDQTINSLISQIDNQANCGIIFGNTNRSRKRYDRCKSISQKLDCVSLALHCMFAIFIDQGLKKQHYRMRN